MYIVLVYDVSQEENGARRWSRIFKICKKYLSHFQKSVFRGEITPSKLIKLKIDLENIIEEEEDFVCIIKMMNGSVFGEEIIGGEKENGENLII